MDEIQEHQPRRKRKKKFRRGRFLSFLFFFLLLAVGAYAFTQYTSGYNLAKDAKKEPADFTGDVREQGQRENVLVLGVDSRGQDKARTDTMMLVSWDRESNNVKIISFMRDIYAEIPGYKSYKLNTAYYLDGVQLVTDTIENMFDVPIHHYALIDFSSFETLVDIVTPDGIPINVEKDMSEKIGVTLKKGQQNLSGEELLGYARFRSDAEGDFGRVARQQIVMEALKDEILSVKNLRNIPKFVGATEGYIETDYSKSDKLKRVLDASVSGNVEIEKLTIPVEGSYTNKSYSHAGSVLEIDKERNKKAISDFLE